MSQKYVVVHFFEERPAGYNFAASEWPLHVTLVPRVSIDKPLEVLIKKVQEAAKTTAPFQITTEGHDMFGPNNDIPVTLVKPSDEIINLHNKLLALIQVASPRYDNPEHNYRGYRPHITAQKDQKIPESPLAVSSLTIVDMFPDGDISRRQALQTFSLAGNT